MSVIVSVSANVNIYIFFCVSLSMLVVDQNPAPGVCLPVIVKFCSSAAYNYTVFPNYIGHFGQLDAEQVCFEIFHIK